MSSKRRRFEEADMFNSDATPHESVLRADSMMYGAIRKVEEGREVVKPTPIFEIHPDPAQPRRVMPSARREHWSGDPKEIPLELSFWIEMVQGERSSFDLDDFLNEPDEAVNSLGASDEEIAAQSKRPPRRGPIEAGFMQVVDLAASIQREGLNNPISVVDHGSHFQLETGERRWMAYHLLHHYTQDDRWLKIPARMVKYVDVWRQAAENSARADLNAIGTARQFAILLMDILGQEHQFKPLSEFLKAGLSEREYYAQVADGNVFRVPRNKGEMLLSALGLKNPQQLRQHRELLRLPDEVWAKADDLSWTQGRISALMRGVKNDEETAQELYTVLNNTVSPTPPPYAPPAHERDFERISSKVLKKKPQERIEYLDYLIGELQKLRQNLG